MVVGQSMANEQVAHREAERCGLEKEERLKGWKLRWPQFQYQHCNKDSDMLLNNALRRSGVALRYKVISLPAHYAQVRAVFVS